MSRGGTLNDTETDGHWFETIL